jgi:hypothetical protein
VLAECQGAGLVEVFETGSVGRGVRLVWWDGMRRQGCVKLYIG